MLESLSLFLEFKVSVLEVLSGLSLGVLLEGFVSVVGSFQVFLGQHVVLVDGQSQFARWV